MSDKVINNYFNSENFWDILSSINIPKNDEYNKPLSNNEFLYKYESILNVLIDLIVRFYLLFPEDIEMSPSLLNDFSKEIISIMNIDLQNYKFIPRELLYLEKYDTIILNYLKKKLNIDNIKSKEDVNVFLQEIYNKYTKKEYMFHSFNQNLFKSIKEKGITTNNSFNSEKDKEILKIFQQYGLLKKDFLQTTDTDMEEVCYASSPSEAYGYGVNSPEWFGNFCGKFSSHKNYHERNYDLLYEDYKKYISKLPESYKKYATDFFNKQWEYYGSTENKPVMAVIPSYDCDITFEDYKEKFADQDGRNYEEKIEQTIRDGFTTGISEHTEYIDTSNALFIQMPSYKKLIELSNQKYYGEKKEEKNNSFEELSKYFNSEQFYNLVDSYNKTDILRSRIRELTNYIIKYSLIIGVEEINIFAKSFVDLCNNGYEEEKAYIELIKKGVTNILERNNIAVKEDSIKEYLSSKLGNSIFKFHAFNSSKLESIKKYGLTTNLSSVFEEKNDIARIEEIIKKYTYPDSRSLFGFYRKSSKDKVYYSLDPVNSYSYANRSPEWFASFVGDSYFYSQEKQGTFFEKDYDKAKDNICEFMNSYNFDDEDKKDVLNFFEKYWNVYGNSKPMLTIIEEKYDNSYLKELNLDTFIKELIKGNVDASTHEKISTENAEFIYLTDYVKIKNYINNNNNNFINYLESYIKLKNTVKKITTKIKFSSTKIDDYQQSNNPLAVKFIEAHKKVLFESADELRKHKKTLYDLKNGLDLFVQMEENNILVVLNYLNNEIGKLKNSNTSDELISLYKEVYDELRLAKVYEENNNTKSR